MFLTFPRDNITPENILKYTAIKYVAYTRHYAQAI